jgi:hypothetical protein
MGCAEDGEKLPPSCAAMNRESTHASYPVSSHAIVGFFPPWKQGSVPSYSLYVAETGGFN